MHSRIEFGRYADFYAVKKFFGKTLTREEREIISIVISTYRKQLNSFGVKIPILYEYRLGDRDIQIIEEFVGIETVTHFLETNMKLDCWDRMLK